MHIAFAFELCHSINQKGNNERLESQKVKSRIIVNPPQPYLAKEKP